MSPEEDAELDGNGLLDKGMLVEAELDCTGPVDGTLLKDPLVLLYDVNGTLLEDSLILGDSVDGILLRKSLALGDTVLSKLDIMLDKDS